jgi:hypothetical protein
MTPAQEEKILDVKRAYDSLPPMESIASAAKALGIPRKTLSGYINIHWPRLGVQPTQFVVATLPEDDLPVEEIIAMRKREFERKKLREEATKLIPISIKIPGPIGILHFGDPHLDDDGTDIGEAFRHAELTRTVEGLFGANLGDTTNNWVGRLKGLYAQQNMGRKRAIKVAEHFIKSARWLYIIAGNHDLWSGDDDPIKWIAGGCNSLYAPSEVRCELRFPKGEPFRINARHDFEGSSQWNPAHALMKAFTMGFRDHLFVAGHKHESGYGMLKDPQSGITGHMVRVASYKIYDRYAKERNFRDQSFGPACVTVIDPELPDTHPDRCKVFWDVDEGVKFLKFKRNK